MKTNQIQSACSRLGFKLVRVPISKPASWTGVGHRWDICDKNQNVIAIGKNPQQAYSKLRIYLKPKTTQQIHKTTGKHIMTAQISKPITTEKRPAFWALGLDKDGVLYAKAFQDHWDAEYFKEACLKNSDCQRVAVTKRKATWETVKRLLSWDYSQVVFTIGN